MSAALKIGYQVRFFQFTHIDVHKQKWADVRLKILKLEPSAPGDASLVGQTWICRVFGRRSDEQPLNHMVPNRSKWWDDGNLLGFTRKPRSMSINFEGNWVVNWVVMHVMHVMCTFDQQLGHLNQHSSCHGIPLQNKQIRRALKILVS